SYYTTCMLDINAIGKITYYDTYPYKPYENNVKSLEINGQLVDFNDANTYYTVSTVNYLAAGSCNFNDGGVSLWPLDQIVHDTQYYVRDAVIEYIKAQTAPINPQIEGRLVFEPTALEPQVESVTRLDASPTSAATVSYKVAFNVGMSGVDVDDFVLSTTGTITGAEVLEVTGSGRFYTVLVSTGTGNGALRLDIPETATISDEFGNAPVNIPYEGEVYTVSKLKFIYLPMVSRAGN
ncbi:MAG: hypothetical protein N2383_16080, partial [Caldilineales bacterium]|nr:hypothetical protein [Caldilineales bacterium]